MKIKVGILFGGISREREVSFAGGRTVYDNLNKSIFDPVPLFVDSFGNLVQLKWEYVYKGSIRDFYPPVDFLPVSPNAFQVYAESLDLKNADEQKKILASLGEPIEWSDLKNKIDFAFLCLHGAFGEDGRVQGLLEYLQIPYSGSGILSSAIGMNKAIQKELMKNAGFACPEYSVIERIDWLKSESRKELFEKIKSEIKIPFVLKPANQGSSIGASVVTQDDFLLFEQSVNRSFFIRKISQDTWKGFSPDKKISYIRDLCDIREGIGLPVLISDAVLHHPEKLLSFIEKHFSQSDEAITVKGLDSETQVLAESFIEGKEFSCIVIRNEDGLPVALPPTEIVKGKEMFDYRSKYLPGLSRKITPIEVADELIEKICRECEKLFVDLKFNVYARIDGFINKSGTVFLNDPNTTSGMLPSSFFFHQAAEIGLNPSQFLTYIIRTSIEERENDFKNELLLKSLKKNLDDAISQLHSGKTKKKKIAVILGGYSFERHISVESGRNIFEKLSSSEKYEPIPVFLTGSRKEHSLYQIPINILLKDNADDIRDKIFKAEAKNGHQKHKMIEQIIEKCSPVTSKYSSSDNLIYPKKISYNELSEMCDGVFIALHGRPGEDGEVQKNLEQVGLAYNGSNPSTSSITIDKFNTNEILLQNGFLVAKHELVFKKDWEKDKSLFLKSILKKFSFPFITKPVDDGCSAAVRKIKNENELNAFASLVFRNEPELNTEDALVLHLKPKEEFPIKDNFLVEELISFNGAKHFLEVTCGMLTSFDKDGKINYEIFEPSEALSGGEVLSLEEKFLAGEGQNITPARFSKDKAEQKNISAFVKSEMEKAARILNIEGYSRIDAFVRIAKDNKTEVIFVEVNSLPGMTPATCIFHQCAINGYKPLDFIDHILEFGFRKTQKLTVKN